MSKETIKRLERLEAAVLAEETERREEAASSRVAAYAGEDADRCALAASEVLSQP